MSFEQLSKELLSQSKSQDWNTARQEWKLQEIHDNPNFQECLCGHYPIREVCVLYNKATGNNAEIGNCCVNHFMKIQSKLLFANITKVRTDTSKSFSVKALDFFKKHDFISTSEHSFLCSTAKKRQLSQKQQAYRTKLNTFILASFKQRKPLSTTQRFIINTLHNKPTKPAALQQIVEKTFPWINKKVLRKEYDELQQAGIVHSKQDMKVINLLKEGVKN